MSAIDHYVEERLLGALLQAGALGAGDRAVARARATGLDDEGRDFWRASFGALYGVMVAMVDAGLDVSPLSVAHELRRRAAVANGALGELHGVDEPKLLDTLHRLAHEATYISAVDRYASLIHEAGAERRRQEESTARPGLQSERSGPGLGGLEA